MLFGFISRFEIAAFFGKRQFPPVNVSILFGFISRFEIAAFVGKRQFPPVNVSILFGFISRFEIAAFVGKRQFPSVKCSNKKDGKTEACDLALRQLIAEGQFQPTSVVLISLVVTLAFRGFSALL